VKGQAKTKDREVGLHTPPVLTALGRRIWGVDKWPSKPTTGEHLKKEATTTTTEE
jgi:hypothetical protein